MTPGEACGACRGCGKVANTDDREPWSVWTSLPLESSGAVLAGLVKPVECPTCHGTGRAQAPATCEGCNHPPHPAICGAEMERYDELRGDITYECDCSEAPTGASVECDSVPFVLPSVPGGDGKSQGMEGGGRKVVEAGVSDEPETARQVAPPGTQAPAAGQARDPKDLNAYNRERQAQGAVGECWCPVYLQFHPCPGPGIQPAAQAGDALLERVAAMLRHLSIFTDVDKTHQEALALAKEVDAARQKQAGDVGAGDVAGWFRAWCLINEKGRPCREWMDDSDNYCAVCVTAGLWEREHRDQCRGDCGEAFCTSTQHPAPQVPAAESLESQVKRLADFIMQNIPGEPSRSEGAIDTAIRLLTAPQVPPGLAGSLRSIADEVERMVWAFSVDDGRRERVRALANDIRVNAALAARLRAVGPSEDVARGAARDERAGLSEANRDSGAEPGHAPGRIPTGNMAPQTAPVAWGCSDGHPIFTREADGFCLAFKRDQQRRCYQPLRSLTWADAAPVQQPVAEMEAADATGYLATIRRQRDNYAGQVVALQARVKELEVAGDAVQRERAAIAEAVRTAPERKEHPAVLAGRIADGDFARGGPDGE